MMKPGNIFSNIPQHLPNEVFEGIVRTKTCTIERIISRGRSSPKDYWYDQDQSEWVILLKGRAALKFEETAGVIEMGPGDYIHISAHCRHRVEWTDPKEETVWLAVFY